jgi:hypothetical protein
LVQFVVIWCIFSRFGILYQEKSGNPEMNPYSTMGERTPNLRKHYNNRINLTISRDSPSASDAARVTRLVEFPPNGLWFTTGSFSKFTKVAPSFGGNFYRR